MNKRYVVIVYYEDEFDGFVSEINYERPIWDTGTPKIWKKKESAQKCAETIMTWAGKAKCAGKVRCKVIEISY